MKNYQNMEKKRNVIEGISKEKILFLSEMMEKFQVTRQTIHVWMKEGKLESGKFLGFVFFTETQMGRRDQYLDCCDIGRMFLMTLLGIRNNEIILLHVIRYNSNSLINLFSCQKHTGSGKIVEKPSNEVMQWNNACERNSLLYQKVAPTKKEKVVIIKRGAFYTHEPNNVANESNSRILSVDAQRLTYTHRHVPGSGERNDTYNGGAQKS